MVIKEKLTIAGGSSSRSYMALLDPKADVNAGTSLTYTPFTPIPSQGYAFHAVVDLCALLSRWPILLSQLPMVTGQQFYCDNELASGMNGCTLTPKLIVEAGALQRRRYEKSSMT